jgi:hypothetical protein
MACRYPFKHHMDKFYTLPTQQSKPRPSANSVALILQYAAAYQPLKLANGHVDTFAN